MESSLIQSSCDQREHSEQSQTKPASNYNVNQIMETIDGLNFVGHTVPHAWFQAKELQKSEKPNLLAIIILADIVYWYRPTPILNETTGKLIGYKKKFKADMLQRSLQNFAELFGCNKRQVADALKFLAEAELITKNLRKIETPMGPLHNVLFVAPNAEAIARLQANFTLVDESVEEGGADDYFVPLSNGKPNPPTPNRATYYDNPQGVLHKSVVPPTDLRSTYTKTTTKITTKKTLTKPGDEIEVQEPVMLLPKGQGLVEGCFFEKIKNPKSNIQTLGVIGTQFTEAQTEFLEAWGRHMCASDLYQISNPKQLLEEVQFTLLDYTQLIGCENSFYRKLCAIDAIVRSGKWVTPFKLQKKKSVKPSKPNMNCTKTNITRKLSELKQKIGELQADIASNENFLASIQAADGSDTNHEKTIANVEKKNQQRQSEIQTLLTTQKNLERELINVSEGESI